MMQQTLSYYFGYETFQPGREEIVSKVLDHRNVPGVLSTGGGKSICYQIPGLLLGGTTIIISPLISLTKDQVDRLRTTGIQAAFLNSGLIQKEQQRIERALSSGGIQFLYVVPERFENRYFLNMLQRTKTHLVASGEAHCISKWGHDFRPSYQDVISKVFTLPQGFTIVALTVTATVEVQQDIRKKLDIAQTNQIKTSTKRRDLTFKISPTYQRRKFILDYIETHDEDADIIYCSTHKQVEELQETLESQKIESVIYHADLSNRERGEAQNGFLFGRVRVVVATNAFGMGIDKSNVRFIIHCNMPGDLESYYQEAGHADRDGLKSRCILLFSERDINLYEYPITVSQADGDYKGKMGEKLAKMIQYTRTKKCLETTIVHHFGPNRKLEEYEQCNNCVQQNKSYDMTQEVEMIIGCIARVKQQESYSVIIQVLRGESTDYIKYKGYDQISTHGLAKGYTASELGHSIGELRFKGSLNENDEILVCDTSIKKLLNSEVEVFVAPFKQKATEKAFIDTVEGINQVLFSQLMEARKKLGDKLMVTPVSIFSDYASEEFVKRRPASKQDTININGAGSYKLKHYCPAFLGTIQNYKVKV